MSLNPFPFPDDWAERVRSWHQEALRGESVLRYRDTVAYPAFRRNLPLSGLDANVLLADLAGVDAGADPTEAEQRVIDALASALDTRPETVRALKLQVADGATAVTTTDRLLLRAHRQRSSAIVTVVLFWPIVTDWRWDMTMRHGTTAEIVKAFETGEVAPRFRKAR